MAGSSNPPPRHRTPAVDVEQALLGAAEQLLADEGPESLSVRRICSMAGVAPMGLYSRFGGKQGLVEAVFLEGFRRLQEVFDEARQGPDGLERLRACAHGYRRFAKDNATRYSVMFDLVVPDFEPSDEAKLQAASSFDTLAQLVQGAIDSAEIVPGNPHEIAQRLWEACHGAVALELRGLGFVVDLDAHYAALVDTMLAGLAPRPEAP